MSVFQGFFSQLKQHELDEWVDSLEPLVAARFNAEQHGDFNQWLEAVQTLPDWPVYSINLQTKVELLGDQRSEHELTELKNQLLKLHPWRKGPFSLHGLTIDTEWRSDWKWDRIIDHIGSLKGKKVLDIGCGNGYHILRMLGADAELVLGIDPTLVFVMQFLAIRHFLGQSVRWQDRACVLPLGIEDLPQQMNGFDSIFSMGVLYHRRSPIDHLTRIKQLLEKEGELILETLVVEGNQQTVFVPPARYAKMRNVWFLPSIDALHLWLKRCGYKDIKLIDVTKTSLEEQRTTQWMHFHSLKNFLDPEDHNKTIEGHPAPLRATFMARV
ncbi:MAG: tRNA 5-methoxyuridine(34)/uridine 5-oxyacetic acid(34) synthase CmoB [bacterium]